MSTIPSWLWLAAGWTLVAAGAWAVVMARGIRTSHGGRRCQKCGYNMAGLATLTCPECGRAAVSELELAKRLRKWPWRVGGLAVVVCGWAVMQTPGVVAHGWAAAVPSPVLALVAPKDLSGWAQANRPASPSLFALPGRAFTGNLQFPASTLPPPLPPPAATTPYERIDQVSDALFDEVWRRLSDDSLGERSGGLYLRRVLGIKGGASDVLMPQVWAVGAPPPVAPRVASASPGAHSLEAWAMVAIAEKPASSMHVTIFTIAGATRYTLATYDHPVDVQRPRETMMRRVQSAEIDGAVIEALAPRLVVNGPSAWVEIDDRAASPSWNKLPYSMHVRVRIMLDSKEIGHTGFGIEPPGAIIAGRIAALVAWEDGGEQAARAMPAGMTFELSGDPMGTAEDSMRLWNDRHVDSPIDTWAGHRSVKPAMVRK